ncbi:MAG: tRNA pseudouridine(55) synthase TruB [Chloroflexota bacterium]|nr:MAG: tRNA pseudouridine(55) synthase TruB [Chloroflexota bacterium]
MSAAIEGLLCLDKSSGPTSHDVVNKIRRLTGIRRVGHAGTLDPLATGLLLVCLGRATRLLEYLVGQPKSYVATIQMGQETDTYDAEGEIIAERAVAVTMQQLSAALDTYQGQISQRAPLFSAVKVDGQPLYRRARRGEDVEPPVRVVTIYQLKLLDRQESTLVVGVKCSSGTYIRSLAHDLGQSLGCGAHLADLRRTEVGSFTLDDAIALDELSPQDWQEHMRPSDSAVSHMARLELTLDEAVTLYHGQSVEVRPGQTNHSPARAYDEAGRFVGIVTAEAARWRARKIFYQPGQG